MAEVKVVALLIAKAGAEGTVQQALEALVAPTRAEEGCLGYELFESLAAPGTFITVESWRAQADLETHLQTPHVQQALAAAGDALAQPPGIHPLRPTVRHGA
jgi:quinol monooxygenase YgiN